VLPPPPDATDVEVASQELHDEVQSALDRPAALPRPEPVGVPAGI
jgi:hypothetical protein